jgi:lysophospholipase L1-like esterase
MSRTHTVVRGALLLGAAAIFTACHSDHGIVSVTPNDQIFSSYVALGNSITAGYQSGGITDSTQRQSYAFLLAKQMNTRFAYPSLVAPGCPPPIANFQTQARLGGATSTSTTCALRTLTSVSATINNVAVPGIASADPTAVVGPNANTLVELFLGGETMVQKALDNHPTFASVWVGNNDILSFAIAGQPGGATPQNTFAQNYGKMISELLAGAPGLKGILIGVVNASAAPVLFTAQALQNPAFVGGLSQAAHKAIVIDPTTCTPTNTSLIGFPIISAIAAGQHPPVIACAKTPTPPLGDIFVLDAAEQAQVNAIVAGYNTYIKAKADSIGFAFFDPNATLARLAASDPVLASHVPNLASATATFGAFVTLDGVHPSAAAHVQIANDLIAAINAKYGTKLAQLQ